MSRSKIHDDYCQYFFPQIFLLLSSYNDIGISLRVICYWPCVLPVLSITNDTKIANRASHKF